MLTHKQQPPNTDRFKLIKSGANKITKDGYSSLKYRRIDISPKRLYTWILVDLQT